MTDPFDPTSEPSDDVLDDMFLEAMCSLNLGKILSGPSLNQLKENLFQEGVRDPIKFETVFPVLEVERHDFHVMLHGLTRYGKTTELWRFIGLYLNNEMRFCKVQGEYNVLTRKGTVNLSGPVA